jgi:5-hydroxyisourate hydrolase
MSHITTHVLDTSRGTPAAGVAVTLERQVAADQWQPVAAGETDADGRLRTLTSGADAAAGVYRLVFDTAGYFGSHGERTFYPRVSICFETADTQPHYHVPLLVSPFGYTTYRGS